MTMEQHESLRLAYMETLGFGTNAMKQIKVCGTCGVVSPAGETACVSCGAALPEETLYQQYQKRHKSCAGCGVVLADHARFCPQCGRNLAEQESGE